jgi:AraC family transcriptional regulator
MQEFVATGHEINVVLRGNFVLHRVFDGRAEARRCGIGSISVQSAMAPRRFAWDKPIQVMDLYLDESALNEILVNDFDRNAEGFELRSEIAGGDALIEQIARHLAAELRSPGPAGRLLAQSLKCVLAVHLIRHWSNVTSRTELARGGLAPARLRRVLEYLDANLPQDLSLADLAGVAELSETHFCRAFKQATGLAPHQYLIHRRVRRARELLARREHTLAEVALALGSSSQSHFTSHFRRLTGTTPKRFRDEG